MTLYFHCISSCSTLSLTMNTFRLFSVMAINEGPLSAKWSKQSPNDIIVFFENYFTDWSIPQCPLHSSNMLIFCCQFLGVKGSVSNTFCTMPNGLHESAKSSVLGLKWTIKFIVKSSFATWNIAFLEIWLAYYPSETCIRFWLEDEIPDTLSMCLEVSL